MDFSDLIKTRRSLRKYDPQKQIPDETLNRILEAGRIAPSAGNRQPWRFMLIKDPGFKKKVCQCYDRDWLKNAPAILIIIGDRDQAWIRKGDGHNSIEVDLTIALDHMILAATNEGVGTCWIIAYDYQKLAATLKLKQNEYVSCLTPLGYPPDDYKKRDMPKKKNLAEIIEII